VTGQACRCVICQQGDCITTSLPGGGIRIDHADPRIHG
jgi:hypothetical protein